MEKLLNELLNNLAKDHPLHKDKLFLFFLKVLLEESYSEYSFSKRLLDMLISSYEYFLQGDLPKIRVLNNHRRSILKNTTAIEAHSKDIKFLLDSIREYLNENNFKTKLIVNPIYSTLRDDSGRLVEMKRGTEGVDRESFIHIEIERIENGRLEQLTTELEHILLAVRDTINDFDSMVNNLREHILELKNPKNLIPTGEDFSLYEAISFLEWALEDNFIFLGYRCYKLYEKNSEFYVQTENNSSKGILRSVQKSSYEDPKLVKSLPKEMTGRIFMKVPLLIDKTHHQSIIHRRVPMDYFEIRLFDKNGIPIIWHRYMGLFTRKALFEQAKNIPILNTKIENLIRDKHIVNGSSIYREYISIFNSLPKEVLFFSTIQELDSLIQLIIKAYREQAVRLYFRKSITGSAISIVVALPEKYFSTHHATIVSNYFRSYFDAKFIQFYQTRSHPGFWEIHYFISLNDKKKGLKIPRDFLEEKVNSLVKEWQECLIELLERKYNGEHSDLFVEEYSNAFSQKYQSAYTVEEALRDIEYFEYFYQSGRHQFLFTHTGIDDIEYTSTTLRIYSKEKISLTYIMPILENLGLKVIDESAYKINPKKGDIFLHVFAVSDMDDKPIDPSVYNGLMEEALLKIMENQLENGILNTLITKTGMNYRKINLLRSYYNYYFQIERIFTRKTVAQIMIKYSNIFKLLYQFYDYKFNPDYKEDERLTGILETQDSILDLIYEVTDINEDRVLKAFYNLIDSTLRTNYYARMDNHVFLISHKIESTKILNIPLPKPFVEIYIYSSEMEGIHLRGGKIARGGLRWSDRVDDYRTEVLALMKTQMTKNAVIVPVGSKGGFIIRSDKQKTSDYVKEQYQHFISGLLDITDNIIDGIVVHPKNVLCYDSEDPYLVVAADKGTAHLSDSANEISQRYNFWLGDAFASGGSYGYDHKKQGITAKGAWECVKRHFREYRKNILKEEFTVVGIGDMSGDVFGNGMLLSDKILLKAAFNHIHIFIDPNPSSLSSYEERKRLFNIPRSTWMDYNKNLISKGGGVFQRNDKAITLSKEIKDFLLIEENSISGDELIKKILQADIELLWNGGIGTYVKSSTETNEQVGDKTNDQVRVNASQLKAKIVGEGGNLGFTQLARIEYAYDGGRINTDAIDNSAGVDMSDHEVNLKILMFSLNQDRLVKDFNERNQILSGLTMDLNHKIVKDNYLQSLAISIDMLRSQINIDRYKELINNLVQNKLLNAQSEYMPSEKDVAEYKMKNRGLLRPQLSVLMSYEKMRVYQEILNSNLPDLPYCNKYLISYFPDQIYAKFNDHILNHHLKREIIATVITNNIINTAGVSVFYELNRDTAYSYPDIAKAYIVVEELLDIPTIRQAIYMLDYEIPAESQYGMLRWIEKQLRNMLNWNLTFKQCLIPDEQNILEMKKDIWEFQQKLQDEMSDEIKGTYQQRLEEDLPTGLPPELAKKILAVDSLDNIFLYLPLANRFNKSILECHNLLMEVDQILQMNVVLDKFRLVKGFSIWDQITDNYLRSEMQFVRYFICKKILGKFDGIAQKFFDSKKDKFVYCQHWVERLKGEDIMSYEPFNVILKFLWNLVN